VQNSNDRARYRLRIWLFEHLLERYLLLDLLDLLDLDDLLLALGFGLTAFDTPLAALDAVLLIAPPTSSAVSFTARAAFWTGFFALVAMCLLE
jgi:hypothetical protein